MAGQLRSLGSECLPPSKPSSAPSSSSLSASASANVKSQLSEESQLGTFRLAVGTRLQSGLEGAIIKTRSSCLVTGRSGAWRLTFSLERALPYAWRNVVSARCYPPGRPSRAVTYSMRVQSPTRSILRDSWLWRSGSPLRGVDLYRSAIPGNFAQNKLKPMQLSPNRAPRDQLGRGNRRTPA